MFQCLSGRKMHEKAFYSQEGQNGLVDLRAIAAGKNNLHGMVSYATMP